MILLKEKELVEVLQCSKRTAYNKLINYNTFTVEDIFSIMNNYSVDGNTALSIILFSSNEYHKRKKERGRKNERIETSSKRI